MKHSILTIGLLTQPRHCGVGDDIQLLAELGAPAYQAITGVNINPQAAQLLPADIVKAQIESIHNIRTVKLGYLGALEQIEAVYAPLKKLADANQIISVLSPDFAQVGGQNRYDAPAFNAFKRDIMLITDLIIPNITEASLLTGMQIRDADDMAMAAEMLLTLGPKAVLLRGGDFREDFETNLFVTDTMQLTFTTPRLQRASLTGFQEAGNAMACAIAHGLAHGHNYETAISDALKFTKGLYLAGL